MRTVFLIKEAQAIIEKQLRQGKQIFHHSKGRSISKYSLRGLFDRIQEATNIYTFTCHVCRHTFVTRLCEKGISAKAIAQIIGHAHTGYVLDIYAMLEQKEPRRAIYALEPDKDPVTEGQHKINEEQSSLL